MARPMMLARVREELHERGQVRYNTFVYLGHEGVRHRIPRWRFALLQLQPTLRLSRLQQMMLRFCLVNHMRTYVLYHACWQNILTTTDPLPILFLPAASCNGDSDLMVGSTLVFQTNREMRWVKRLASSLFSGSRVRRRSQLARYAFTH
jgi:hypothetical protein